MSSVSEKILLATAKGLVTYSRKNGQWFYEKTDFLGQPASIIYVDQVNGIWWLSLAHKHWGQKLHYSEDQGQSWKQVGTPKYPEDAEISPGKPATLRYIWSVAQGGNEHPDRLLVGTDPGGLFITKDKGNTFELVESLWNHESRPEHWFGGGRDNAGIHSIEIDPRNSDHIYIGVSCAGVFESFDGGKSWKGLNKGLKANYLPDPHVEYGHDPHAIRICKSFPDVIWQQNHCGIFRSKDAGANWIDVSDSDGLANYGFCLAINDDNPDEAWVIPAVSDQLRVAIDQSLSVCKTDDGGKSWRVIKEGLPQGASFDIVLRHALAKRDKVMVFGTNAGNLFVSEDAGESWNCLNNYLPTIFSVSLT